MTGLKITEAGTVQFPMVRHAAEIGWTPLTPQEALARRGGTGGMLFRGELETARRRFNPWMADDTSRSTIERLSAAAHHRRQPRHACLAARRAAGV